MPRPCPMNPLPATDARCCNPPHFCSATGLLGFPMTMLAAESRLAPTVLERHTNRSESMALGTLYVQLSFSF